MSIFPTPPNNNRIGFHYFPDYSHFREDDLRLWLPRLHALGAKWLTLVAPLNRAIPELFLNGLLSEGIEPILHFQFSLDSPPQAQDIQLLLSAYYRWGVHYVIFFDRPNNRCAWSTKAWIQDDLVERFLDRFLPLAKIASEAGLKVVFPPLTPGGDYWDTTFLRAALQAIEHRGNYRLLENLVLAAYAYAGDRSLDWGYGGPERWPATRPYITPPGSQDQCGFRIADWYIPIAQAVIGQAIPVMLLGLGKHPGFLNHTQLDNDTHTKRILTMAQTLAFQEKTEIAGQNSPVPIEPFPPQVLCGNFWLLASDSRSPHISETWFFPNGDQLPIVSTLHQFVIDLELVHSISDQTNSTSKQSSHPISHYLLLPSYDWGVSDWHLIAARPYIKKHLPTIGFSLAEAVLAARITVVGSPYEFPETVLNRLRAAGCRVEQISGDGMSIATELVDR